ncbi:hypothetical protein SKAU_G00216920 [Synaphobranchus kaupii]|uniref:Uncharacterized protein n=1 Tax=Synaphobranchus kaupii TaxID=118154 RepID=A0A9Q1FA76_SYNKA|nr:hypothetical protein SKAU_G00216920 [Synaphobranchus kaupii]
MVTYAVFMVSTVPRGEGCVLAVSPPGRRSLAAFSAGVARCPVSRPRPASSGARICPPSAACPRSSGARRPRRRAAPRPTGRPAVAKATLPPGVRVQRSARRIRGIASFGTRRGLAGHRRTDGGTGRFWGGRCDRHTAECKCVFACVQGRAQPMNEGTVEECHTVAEARTAPCGPAALRNYLDTGKR